MNAVVEMRLFTGQARNFIRFELDNIIAATRKATVAGKPDEAGGGCRSIWALTNIPYWFY